jgi:hypothetical protein
MIRDTISEEMDEMDSYDQDETPLEGQPPLSPAGGAESLFLAGLATSKISADALSNRLRLVQMYPDSDENKRSVSAASLRSVLTDDFQSCAQFSDSPDFPFTDDEDDLDDDDTTSFFSIFKSPIKKMSTSTSSYANATKKAAKTESVAPTPAAAKEEGMDIAEQVYEKAKGVWAWGKGVPLISIGFGITEAVVGKAMSVAGTDFETLDNQIKPQLEKFDHDVVDPAIKAVIGAVMNAASKSEGFVKPIVIKILSPFGLIKNEAENPELTK